MKILFFAPRFHTNQYHIVKGLKEKGHDIKFYVQRKSFTENHSVLKPTLMYPSILWLILKIIFILIGKRKKLEDLQIRWFIPNIFHIFFIIIKEKPSLSIIRDRSICSLVIYLMHRILLRKNVILYNQSELSTEARKSIVKSMLFPRIRITPVVNNIFDKSKNYCLIPYKGDYFIPFIGHTVDRINRQYYNDGKINIIVVGKYRDYKNLFIIPEALKYVEYDNIIVRIVGQCQTPEEKKYFKELQKKIIDENLSEKIELYTNIPHNQMDSLYLKSDVFILTSKKELASISIIEAMSFGITPISTNNNGTASYINQEYGFIFESKNKTDLGKILNYLKQVDLEEFGRLNFRYYQKNYMFKNYFECLNRIVYKEFGLRLF